MTVTRCEIPAGKKRSTRKKSRPMRAAMRSEGRTTAAIRSRREYGARVGRTGASLTRRLSAAGARSLTAWVEQLHGHRLVAAVRRRAIARERDRKRPWKSEEPDRERGGNALLVVERDVGVVVERAARAVLKSARGVLRAGAPHRTHAHVLERPGPAFAKCRVFAHDEDRHR